MFITVPVATANHPREPVLRKVRIVPVTLSSLSGISMVSIFRKLICYRQNFLTPWSCAIPSEHPQYKVGWIPSGPANDCGITTLCRIVGSYTYCGRLPRFAAIRVSILFEVSSFCCV